MTGKFFSPHVFTLAFGLAYSIAVYGNYPVFRYYPLVKRFSVHDLVDPMLGPAMAWYGWIAAGAAVGVLAAAIVPKKLGNRIPGVVLWFVPLMMLLAAWYREREWFFPVF